MTDAPRRQRQHAPVHSLLDHAISPPPRGFPAGMMPERPPVRRNLFGSQLSSRMTSSQPSPDLPSFPPSEAAPPSRDPTRRPRQMSSSSDETTMIDAARERPRFSISRDRSSTQIGQPPPPRMGRIAPTGMRRPAGARQRPRRSDEDEIVVRDASGDYALSDPVAVIMAGRRAASTRHGHGEFEDEHNGEESDSDGEAAEERRLREYEGAERKRIAEAIRHHTRDRSRADSDPAELLESVKVRMKDLMSKLEDDEWMFSAGDHK